MTTKIMEENENQWLWEEIARLREIIRNAKDITPIQRISFSRVARLAKEACLAIARQGTKILVSLGKNSRTFKNIREAWEFLSQDE